jgi:Protein of unknown function (DUF4227)
MVISLRKLKDWCQFILLFILFTLMLYQLISFLTPLFKPDFMYKQPAGGAVKVFAYADRSSPSSFLEEVKERLLEFYWIGE